MLVTSQWLAEHLGDADLVVVDMRWREDGTGRALYDRSHIAGAVYLDWSTDLVDDTSPVAFTVARPEQFAEAMEAQGVGDESVVVAYSDQMGSGPYRLWWASRMYGHDTVRVLDGGWEAWSAEHRPVSGERVSRKRARWGPGTSAGWIATAADVAAAATAAGAMVLDSRPPEQFRGRFVWFETGQVSAGPDGVARTPRGNYRAGHVPGAVNVPYADLYRDDRTMKSPEELREMFARAGIGTHTRAITYCGCGISASALLYALRMAGVEDAALYDASWEEWGRDPQRPVARD